MKTVYFSEDVKRKIGENYESFLSKANIILSKPEYWDFKYFFQVQTVLLHIFGLLDVAIDKALERDIKQAPPFEIIIKGDKVELVENVNEKLETTLGDLIISLSRQDEETKSLIKEIFDKHLDKNNKNINYSEFVKELLENLIN